MKRISTPTRTLVLFLCTLVLVVGTGCNKSGQSTRSKHPGTDAGARAMLGEFVKKGANHKALAAELRPTKEDYEAVFDAETAQKLFAAQDALWQTPESILPPPAPEQTDIQIIGATTMEFQKWNGYAKDYFSEEWKKVAQHLKPGLKVYGFGFAAKGAKSAMTHDGLVYVNGHWRLFPKPYASLG